MFDKDVQLVSSVELIKMINEVETELAKQCKILNSYKKIDAMLILGLPIKNQDLNTTMVYIEEIRKHRSLCAQMEVLYGEARFRINLNYKSLTSHINMYNDIAHKLQQEKEQTEQKVDEPVDISSESESAERNPKLQQEKEQTEQKVDEQVDILSESESEERNPKRQREIEQTEQKVDEHVDVSSESESEERKPKRQRTH